VETESVQDYLKTIYVLEESGPQVSTSAIADRLSVSPASVTAMVKRLADRGLLRHHPYRGVTLTERGRALGQEVLRHHRLIEAYLHKALGISWDRVHDEAEVLEHALSEELEDRMAELLGHPTRDPHGDPIPPKRGRHTELIHAPLVSCGRGPARVERVSDRDPSVLRYLNRLGIVPGTAISVEEHSPFGGPVWIRVGRKRHALSRELASSIYVSTAAVASGSKGAEAARRTIKGRRRKR
jgi:DtxR family Mn-dependent transcriptional regulator